MNLMVEGSGCHYLNWLIEPSNCESYKKKCEVRTIIHKMLKSQWFGLKSFSLFCSQEILKLEEYVNDTMRKLSDNSACGTAHKCIAVVPCGCQEHETERMGAPC